MPIRHVEVESPRNKREVPSETANKPSSKPFEMNPSRHLTLERVKKRAFFSS
jgi:hypothetical protein